MALVILANPQLIRIRFTTGIIGLVQFPIMPQGWDGHMKCQCYFLFPHRNVAGRLGINMVACLCAGGLYRFLIGQRSDIAGVTGFSIDEKLLFPCWQIEISPHQSGIGNVGIHRILDGARLRIGRISIFAESSLTHCCQLRGAASAVVLILYRHGIQPTVAGKGTITDGSDRAGDHQGLKSAGSFCAVGLDVKRIASDGLQSLMKRQGAVWLFPEPVVGKSAVSNACDALRDLDLGQAAGIEGVIGDCLQAFAQGYFLQTAAAIKSRLTHIGNTGQVNRTCQFIAVLEGMVSYIGQAGRIFDLQFVQRGYCIKGMGANPRHTICNVNSRWIGLGPRPTL